MHETDEEKASPTGSARPGQDSRPAQAARQAAGTASGMTAADWNAVGIPMAVPHAPSWLDETPDWHPFP